MGGDERDDWWRAAHEEFLAEERREEERQRQIARAIAFNQLTPADHAAALVTTPDVADFYEALEHALGRADVDPASPQAEALRAARDCVVSLCGPEIRSLDQRRAALVRLVEQARSSERRTPRELVEELRELDPAAMQAHDEKSLLAAWDEALSHGNRPIRTAARVSIALDLFGDRGSYAPGKKAGSRLTSKELDQAENAFRSALDRLRRR